MRKKTPQNNLTQSHKERKASHTQNLKCFLPQRAQRKKIKLTENKKNILLLLKHISPPSFLHLENVATVDFFILISIWTTCSTCEILVYVLQNNR